MSWIPGDVGWLAEARAEGKAGKVESIGKRALGVKVDRQGESRRAAKDGLNAVVDVILVEMISGSGSGRSRALL